jgi:flagellar basal body-associated protein FliL
MTKGLIAILVVITVSLGLAFVVGCESSGQTDALVGTGVGALAGQAIGHSTESTLIGAAVGGGAGYMVGNEQDKKKTKAEMESMRQEMSTVTVNVTNSNGSIIQVKLAKQGVGYVGPRGEYYDKLPTQEQLRPIYGF